MIWQPLIERSYLGLRIIAVFSLFTFLFQFAWEILQTPLFVGMPVGAHWKGTLICLKATSGDVGIGLASFAVGAWWDKSLRWAVRPSARAFAASVVTGVFITILFEWYAVHWAGRWAYSVLMPIVPILRVGAAPLLQWILLPRWCSTSCASMILASEEAGLARGSELAR